MTDALVQCPKLCPYISRIAVMESQPRSGRDSFLGTLRTENTRIDVTAGKDKHETAFRDTDRRTKLIGGDMI